jgi:phage gpG-like protein
VTLQEYIKWLEKTIARMELGAPAMASAMAEYLAGRTADDTLRQVTHSPGAYYKARPGSPPAYVSGTLARNMFWNPPESPAGTRATAIVGNSARHAKLHEHGGCVLRPSRAKVMAWKDSEGAWHHFSLAAPAHPFLEPAIEEAVDDGSLTACAIDAFEPYDP